MKAKVSKMRLFKIFFQQRLSNFYSLSSTVLFISLLFSSCATTKEGSYAYMDDIYLDSYVNTTQVLTDNVIDNENGEPPTNVPGAAYVYQPIPEPTLSSSIEEPYVYSPYTSVYDDFYSEDNYNSTGYYNSLYGRPLPFGVDINFLFFNALSLASYYNYGYYPNNYSGACPSSSNNNGGSSSSFIAKRFSWNTSPDEIIQYLGNVSKNSQSNVSTTKRNSSSSKSRYSSSGNSTSEKGNGFSKFISTATEILNDSRSGGTTRSSDGSSGGSSGSRSGGSSKSTSTYSGKRIR
jgi:hypothetical protein